MIKQLIDLYHKRRIKRQIKILKRVIEMNLEMSNNLPKGRYEDMGYYNKYNKK